MWISNRQGSKSSMVDLLLLFLSLHLHPCSSRYSTQCQGYEELVRIFPGLRSGRNVGGRKQISSWRTRFTRRQEGHRIPVLPARASFTAEAVWIWYPTWRHGQGEIPIPSWEMIHSLTFSRSMIATSSPLRSILTNSLTRVQIGQSHGYINYMVYWFTPAIFTVDITLRSLNLTSKQDGSNLTMTEWHLSPTRKFWRRITAEKL